ncbi:uncharacterized protein LOC106716951 [Papilio machaon]|uniref:uncharacterized protein LOC106716951 n=1 Tax=Papilio machaon TaxID=76193 RepID=UPI001E665303|nr:uncharacterized protein LOC106716951 [Papilio machaon]
MIWMTRTCLSVVLYASVLGVKVIFERARVIYFNPKYVENAWGNVTRYERHGDYYVNAEFITKCAFGNNATLTIKFYEFRWNAYKLSLVHFHYKVCDFLERDPYIGAVVAPMFGSECPLPPGKYTLMNVTTHMDNFPNVFPFEKGRANLLFTVTSTGELLADAELYLSFKNNIKSKTQRG